jgi:hypothetical protein
MRFSWKHSLRCLLIGRRRNLSNTTIASFVLLSSIGSMGYSLSLFFITMLYTPLTIHRDATPLHDALFTPYAFVYDIGIVASLITLNLFPQLVSEFGDKSMLRLGYLAMPLAFAFAPQVSNMHPLQLLLLTSDSLCQSPWVISTRQRPPRIALMQKSSTHCQLLLSWYTGVFGQPLYGSTLPRSALTCGTSSQTLSASTRITPTTGFLPVSSTLA